MFALWALGFQGFFLLSGFGLVASCGLGYSELRVVSCTGFVSSGFALFGWKIRAGVRRDVT